MSQNENAEVVNIVPNRYNYFTELKLGTRIGNSSVIDCQEYEPTKGMSPDNAFKTGGGNVGWNIISDAYGFTDSAPIIQYDVYVGLSNTGNDLTIDAVNGRVGLHSLAVNRSISQASIKLNGHTPINSNPAEALNSILYSSSQKQLELIGKTATPDNLFDYKPDNIMNVLRNQNDSLTWGRGLGSVEVVRYWNGGQANSNDGEARPDLPTSVKGAGNNNLVIQYRVRERLIAEPYQWFDEEARPLLAVHTLEVNLQFASDFKSALGAVDVENIDSAGKAFEGVAIARPRLCVRENTPHLNLQMTDKPVFWNVPTFDSLMKSTPAPLAAGATTSFDIRSKPFNVVPKFWAIYVLGGERDGTQPERLLPIKNIVMDFGTKRNLLLSRTPQDLFAISSRNGYNGNASMFLGGVPGYDDLTASQCVVYITPSDIDTDELIQSNVLSSYNVSFKVQAQNPSTKNLTNVVAVAQPVFDSVLSYANGHYEYDQASLLPSQVNPSREDTKNIFMDTSFEDNHVMGGNIFKKIKKGLTHPIAKSAIKGVRQALRAFEPAGMRPFTAPLHDLADRHGYGKKKKRAPAKKKSGSGLITLAGGKKLDENNLMKLLGKK